MCQKVVLRRQQGSSVVSIHADLHFNNLLKNSSPVKQVIENIIRQAIPVESHFDKIINNWPQ